LEVNFGSRLQQQGKMRAMLFTRRAPKLLPTKQCMENQRTYLDLALADARPTFSTGVAKRRGNTQQEL
jgi:hypothetical protein